MAAAKKSRYRFFIDPLCIDSQSGLARSEDVRLSHQVRNVLRLKNGDQAELLDGLGNIYQTTLRDVGRTYIEFNLSHLRSQPKPHLQVVSYLPLIKAHRFEWALEKLTELGVSRIVPFYSERCVVKAKADEEGRSKRWQSICREASEQSERAYLPELAEPLSLDAILAGTTDGGNRVVNLLLAERSQAPDMVATLDSLVRPKASANQAFEIKILSGPEGGFSDAEQKQIGAKNFVSVSLGPSILRAETASILAVGLVCAMDMTKD